MDLHTAQLLTSPEGERALTLATGLPDPDSLGAGERMRREFAPELAAAALSQMGLRRRARAKLGPRADLLLWTSDGVEQATRASVSAWRARRLVSAGITTVLDIGCGAGADALAFLDAGLSVTGVEIDPATALLARHNLSTADAGA
ncbi:MAG: methyltransferase domain-containing protein, partial [Propionibacterium sp.]|nr:methyltransferase domain-containing protein [Propionibacterium sp.]